MGNIEVIEYLATRKEINYEAEDDSKRTPLLAAVQKGKENIVKYLTEVAKVNVNAIKKYRQNAIQIAINNHYIKTFKYLISTSKLDINHRDADDYISLTYALKYCLKYVRYNKKNNGEIKKKMLNEIISIYQSTTK